MGAKRALWCGNKHHWHLSSSKRRRIDKIFEKIDIEKQRIKLKKNNGEK